MSKPFRVSLAFAVLYIVVGVAVGTLYYAQLRPSFITPTFHAEFTDRLNDPRASSEELKAFALRAHDAIFAGYGALDKAVDLLLVVSFVAAGGFGYLCWRLKGDRGQHT